MLILTAQADSNFRCLLLELILADRLAHLPPIVASSGQEWQCDISTVSPQSGRSSGFYC